MRLTQLLSTRDGHPEATGSAMATAAREILATWNLNDKNGSPFNIPRADDGIIRMGRGSCQLARGIRSAQLESPRRYSKGEEDGAEGRLVEFDDR